MLKDGAVAASDKLARLQSSSTVTRTSATYELERSDFKDSQILAAVRENLSSYDPDLLDVTIMRLLVRGRDVCSAERVMDHVEGTRDDLVFSSGVLALSSLASHFPDLRGKVLRRLERLPKEHLSARNRSLLADTIRDLRGMLA